MNRPKEVLIAPVRDTPLVDALMRPECMRPVEGIDPPLPAEELVRLEKRFYEMDTGVAGDALLYLAPAAELIPMPMDPTMWMDVDYYEELGRRMQIRNGRPPPAFAVNYRLAPTFRYPAHIAESGPVHTIQCRSFRHRTRTMFTLRSRDGATNLLHCVYSGSG